MTEHSSSGPVFHQHVHAGGVGAQGVEVTQNVGVQAAELPRLVALLRELAPEPGSPDHDGWTADVGLLADPAGPAADRASAWHRIRAALTRAGTGVAAAGVVALGDQVAAALS